jgi:hypothetical protein
MATMNGVVLPGDSTVKHVEVNVPEPGHGQVLLQMKASSICGSDIRAIYREHLGSGPEAYRGVIAGTSRAVRWWPSVPVLVDSPWGTVLWCTTLPAAASVRSAVTAT